MPNTDGARRKGVRACHREMGGRSLGGGGGVGGAGRLVTEGGGRAKRNPQRTQSMGAGVGLWGRGWFSRWLVIRCSLDR